MLLVPTPLRDSFGPGELAIGWTNYMWVTLMGAVQLTLGLVLFTLASRSVPARAACLLALVEPTLGPVWAFVAVDEVPPVSTLIGGVVVMRPSSSRCWRPRAGGCWRGRTGEWHDRAIVLVRLKKRPVGEVAADDFAIVEEPLAEPQDGEIRVRTAYVSLDPAMRGWIAEGRSYVEPVAIGDVMRAYAAGHVELSRNPKFAVGDAVTGLLGVQSHAISNGKGVLRVDDKEAPLPTWLGGLGMPGTPPYFGLSMSPVSSPARPWWCRRPPAPSARWSGRSRG